MSGSEADARIIIDDLLKKAGWDPMDKSQVLTEVIVRDDGIVAEAAASYGGVELEPEGPVSGRADYVLLNQRGRPLAVIEAKKDAIQPYTAKQQALPYAKGLGAPFIFLTNGELIYFWDWQNDDARIVNSIYSRRDLERIVFMRENRQALATIPIPEYYLRSGEQREVRPYQREAMKALDVTLELGKRRFLMELPTGTGKTDMICLYLKRLFEAGRAQRVLFLVDREQLAKQALEAIQDLLPSQSSYWLKAGRAREEKEITVCLLQTMISQYQDFTAGYFDVVIMDESHRSIYGSWQPALTHFDAFHVGLTATPADYIDRNTYRFYQCKGGKPDFTFDIVEAIQSDFLVGWKFARGITELIAEGTEIDGQTYEPAQFEREWTNEDTNRKMMEEFDRLAHENWQELAPGLKEGPGKAIVFAITKHHAARLAEYLNKLHPEHHGRYAEVITSDIADADQVIRRFKREKLPMVAVSVDMLTTGFDCREALHIVLCRRVLSPILYQQIRGRGTRTAPHIKKKKFVIYDFFRNKDHFGDTDTDIFTGGSGRGSGTGGGSTRPPGGPRHLEELDLEDRWLERVHYVEVGPEGRRYEKDDYRSYWESFVQQQNDDDPVLQKIRTGEPLTEVEEERLAGKLNRPDHYFNEDNLRRAYDQQESTIIDFVKEALGLHKKKSRAELMEENFQAWLISKNVTPEQAQYLMLLKNRGVAKGQVNLEDLFEPPLSILNAAGAGIELFGEQRLREVIEELNDAVFAAAN